MHLLYKLKRVYFFNSLFIMLPPGSRSKLMTLKVYKDVINHFDFKRFGLILI